MYLQILKLAADESQQAVEDIVRVFVAAGEAIDIDELRRQVVACEAIAGPVKSLAIDIAVEPPDLNDFNCLIPTFSKDGTDDNDTETETETEALIGTSQSRLEQEQGGDQDGPERKLDDAIQGAADADVPGSIRSRRDAGGSGESELLGLSFGTDDAGMPIPTRGPNQTDDDTIPASGRQDLDDVRSDATAAGRSPATGDASRRIVLGSPRESSAVRQTGLGETPTTAIPRWLQRYARVKLQSRIRNILCLARHSDFPGLQHCQGTSANAMSRFARVVTAMWRSPVPIWPPCRHSLIPNRS